MQDRRINDKLAYHVRTTCLKQNRRSEFMADRRVHRGWTRILFIPVGELITRFVFGWA